jgi:hypothetical protein
MFDPQHSDGKREHKQIISLFRKDNDKEKKKRRRIDWRDGDGIWHNN